MKSRLFIYGMFFVSVLLITFSVSSVLAGGPVCPPMRAPVCGPPMPVCAPPPPPICAPLPCPQPVYCPPSYPPITCAPPPCPPPACPPPCPPPACRENPLAALVKGACTVVAKVAALPFKILDCLFAADSCPPNCYPGYRQVAMCAPPPCPPPVCGPGYAAVGYGM